MIKKTGHQEGIALVMAMFATVVILGALAVVTHFVHSAKRFTDETVQRAVADETAKAGIDLGIEQIWNQYLLDNQGAVGNLVSYRLFINDVVPNNEDVNGNGTMDAEESDSNGDGAFEVAAPVMLINEENPRVLSSGGKVLAVTASRTDDISGSTLVFQSTGRYGSVTRTFTQSVRVSGQPFQGFEFAVLANNINCILCHAEFHALDLDYNEDLDLYGTFDRIKIATLESLLFRTGEAHSGVAGTVYTRGDVYNSNGTPMSASGLASSTFKGYKFDDTNGEILQNASTGNMSTAALLNADYDEDGYPEQYANLYQEYPADSEYQTDGMLPNSFPAPFPDTDGDRYVDDGEFAPVMYSANGSITGGIAFGVPAGLSYGGDALPGDSNEALTELSGGSYAGNLILYGTEDNPIAIDGKVAIDGDLVIKGYIDGYGQLLVRGNTYVVGDVIYDDAPGEFGVAESGSQNALAIASGGSIMLGDYLTIRGKNHSKDNTKYPDKNFSIDFRQEHKSGNKKIKGKTETLQYGYFDPGVVDAGQYEEKMVLEDGSEVPRQGQQFSFTTSELMLFNNMELEKAAADSGYRPRFYGLRDTQPANIYVYDSPDEHSVRYDESGGGVQLITDYMVDNGIPLSILDNASFHYMNARNNWISEDTLRQMWWNDEMSRPSSGKPFQFDGLLYSNNAIFALTHSRTRHESYTDGRMLLRGAIIAPDLGMLIPGNQQGTTDVGLTLLYDRRVAAFLQLEDTSQVTFQRVVYIPTATGVS